MYSLELPGPSANILEENTDITEVLYEMTNTALNLLELLYVREQNTHRT